MFRQLKTDNTSDFHKDRISDLESWTVIGRIRIIYYHSWYQQCLVNNNSRSYLRLNFSYINFSYICKCYNIGMAWLLVTTWIDLLCCLFKTSFTIWIRTIKFLLIYQVHGAGAQQHGAAPADVCLVSLQHHVRTSSVSEHNLAGKSLNQYLGNVLSIRPGDQLFLWNSLAYRSLMRI